MSFYIVSKPFFYFFPIIFLMWYSYLLQNQKNGWLSHRSPVTNFSFASNQDIFYKYLLQNSNYSRQSSLKPIVIVEKKQIGQIGNIKIQEISKVCQYSQKSENIIKTKEFPKFNAKRKMIKKETGKIKKSSKAINQDQLKSKNPGRNSTSNIFRVFLKLCSKGKLEEVVQEQFEKLIERHKIQITFDYFKLRLKEISPSTSNYVNMKEFKKIWLEETQFSKTFRCLFHWFASSFAINHSLTLKGKHKMMKESILHFLSNLHEIEEELCKIQGEDQQNEKGKYGDEESSKISPTL